MGRASASRTLLSAAIGGLLCVGSSACNSEDEPAVENGALSDAGTEAAEEAAVEVDSGVEDSGSTTQDAAPDVAVEDASEDVAVDVIADAGLNCDPVGPDAEPGVNTLSETKEVTLEDFTADCDALGGTIEIHPHCGGANTCKGMSYDTGTKVYTEHTCKGLNTCAGFSCVLCPPETD
jgi:hypothetical protein